MWRNPKFFPPEQQEAPAEAPQESGKRIATFPRTDRDGGESELRVSLDSYLGHAFISARLWSQDRQSGSWWPTKKGCTIRLGEVRDFAAAILDALAMAERERPAPEGRGPRRRVDPPQRAEPARRAPDRDFSEL